MIYIDTPTKVRIPKADVSDIQLQQLKAALTYTNKTAVFELSRLKKQARWMSEEEFNEKQESLKAQTKVCLLFEEGSSYWTYSGLANFVAGTLRQPIQNNIQNNIQYPEPQLLPWDNEPPYKMYPYQQEAVGRLLTVKHGAVQLATGLGKTYIITNLVKQLGLKTVVMAPSTSIASQIYRDFIKFFGKKYVGKFFDGKKEPKKKIVVGTAQSLTKVEEGSEAWADFSSTQVFCSDESHQNPSKTMAKVCFGLMGQVPYRFYFSATQERNDGADILLDGITGPIVQEKTVREGVDEGFLAKPIFHMYFAPAFGSYEKDDPNSMTRHHLYSNPKVIAHAAKLANQAAKAGMPVLILIDEVPIFAKLLPHFRFVAGFAHGPLAENKARVPKDYWESDVDQLVKDFDAGKFPILVGTSCISCGTDIKTVRFLIYLKGGKSSVEVRQGIGRGTRLSPGKNQFHAVDYWVKSPSGDLLKNDGKWWTVGAHAKERKAIYNDLYGPVIEEGDI
jgi:superfamily II DNA or RNA helicase